MMRIRVSRAWTLLVLLALLPLFAMPSRAQAAQQVETLGWVLRFDFSQTHRARVTATFQYLLKYQGSDRLYDVGGIEQVQCAARPRVYGRYSCAIPDMPALIYRATKGQVDLNKMQLPLGLLEACGMMVRPAATSKERTEAAIITTGASKLYAMGLSGRNLSLRHSGRADIADAPRTTTRVQLALPDTTLIAPRAYNLDIQPLLAEHYALNELIVVDPGAFAHIADETCGGY